LRALRGTSVADSYRTGPRVGVSTGVDVAWRFWIDGDDTVSAYRRHVSRRHPA
jgi:DNA-3-methyladenine glycosylase